MLKYKFAILKFGMLQYALNCFIVQKRRALHWPTASCICCQHKVSQELVTLCLCELVLSFLFSKVCQEVNGNKNMQFLATASVQQVQVPECGGKIIGSTLDPLELDTMYTCTLDTRLCFQLCNSGLAQQSQFVFHSVSSQAKVLNSIRHKNIVQFYGALNERPSFGIVMGESGLFALCNSNLLIAGV